MLRGWDPAFIRSGCAGEEAGQMMLLLANAGTILEKV